jgi:hypothetical protein
MKMFSFDIPDALWKKVQARFVRDHPDAGEEQQTRTITAILLRALTQYVRRQEAEAGKLGGEARARTMSAEQRKEIARKAAESRWGRKR